MYFKEQTLIAMEGAVPELADFFSRRRIAIDNRRTRVVVPTGSISISTVKGTDYAA